MTTVAVVGLGKIGLPLAVQFAGKGMDVIGCDVIPSVVESINRGRSHILEEPGLDERVKQAVAEGRLKATTDTSGATAAADVVVVIVPLLVAPDHSMDFRNIDAATQAVARGLRRGTLVVYETTLPVGTTRQRLGPMLAQESGLTAGNDFFLAFSPERVYAGRVFHDLRKYPKIVGGHRRAEHRRRPSSSTATVLDAEVWPWRTPRRRSSPSWSRRPIATSTSRLANEFALYAATRDGQRRWKPSRPPTPSPTRTSTDPASASAATASPCTRTSCSTTTRRAS